MTLIPSGTGNPLSYYCTWGAQWRFGADQARAEAGGAAVRGVDIAAAARDLLNERALFEDPCLVEGFPADVRGDLFFVIDDGWDVEPGYDWSRGRLPFGSVEVNRERFPSFTGSPEKRLAALNDRVKAAGWHGLGIWVAAQGRDEASDSPWTDTDTTRYWRERIRWCREADVRYWKVDWGARMKDLRWHALIQEIADREFPQLIIEHAYGTLNVNQGDEDVAIGRFRHWNEGLIAEESAALASRSDVFRTYDVKGEVSTAVTLDRVAWLLGSVSAESGHSRILNCESELQIAAGLGCSVGIMGGYPGTSVDERDLIRRLVRWQRIAPPFGVTADERCRQSAAVNTDWFERDGNTVHQGAPAIVTRGAVDIEAAAAAALPYVLASRHPNGSRAVSVVPRSSGGQSATPSVSLSLASVEVGRPVGLFGRFDSVELRLSPVRRRGGSLRVLAQDLLSESAVDISYSVRRRGDRILVRQQDLLSRCSVEPKHTGDDSTAGGEKRGWVMLVVQSG